MPGPAQLLAAWEAALAAKSPMDRAHVLHALAEPDSTGVDLLAKPIGSRDAALVDLRRTLFGDRMPVLLTCSGCEAELEFELSASDLLDGRTASQAEQSDEHRRTFESGRWTICYRLPTVADLTEALATGEQARRTLIGKVVQDARCDDASMPISLPENLEDLPHGIFTELAEHIAADDPALDIRLRTRCPECQAEVLTQLDIPAFLWAEFDVWARSLMADVHLLAMSYGWTEADVLTLSPLRRRYYLELAGYA